MTSAASSSRPTGLAMTRSRLTRSSRRPASGWPRWSQRTARSDHWLAVPFLPRGPSGPTQRHSQDAGAATRRRRWTPSGGAFATRSSGSSKPPVKSDDVRGKQFPSTTTTLAMTRSRLTRSSMRPASGWPRWSRRTGQTGPLVSGAILAGWAEWADSTRFSTTRRLREGYDTAEVDAFREDIRDTFLGVRRPPLTWPAAPGKQFTTTRAAWLRRGAG